MSTVIAINGSPRKAGSTATLLGEVLSGASEAGAETEMVHLYDLNFRGCLSCFACKRRDGHYFGRCAVGDELGPVLERMTVAQAVVFGSPIYLSDVTGELRSCLERFVFPNISYDDFGSYFKGKLNVGFVYTMNVDREGMREHNYEVLYSWHSSFSRRVFGGGFSYLVSTDTWQFDDYAKYAARGFDVERKARVRAEDFPRDRERARSMGKTLATESS